MNYPILIVGAEVNVHQLIMYRADGETIDMQQGDPRIRDLVAKLAVALETGERTYWLTEEDMSGRNHYAEAEKKTNGLVRFFKVAKTKLKEIAEKFLEPIAPMALGSRPTTDEPVHMVNGEPVEALDDGPGAVGDLPKEEHRPLTQSAEAVAEIMANAVTTSNAGFGEATSEQTIVAVTSNNTVIPGVEQISQQMQAVSENVGSANGLTKFFDRMATVKRGHSVEDLLKFMQKGELPIADDGCALVYKRLQSTGETGVYVDVHSKKVKQRVGSFVHMAEHMVDPNRSQDCSNGLHVARRDYLSAFSGNVTVLAKLAPEDVIAVPTYDARKLRAKAYHIIAVLSPEDARRVCSNQPMQDTQLLANAVAGNHVGILEYVEITQGNGGGLKVTPAGEVIDAPVADVSGRTVHSLDHLNGVSVESSSVDARALALDLAKPGSDSTAVTTFTGDQVTDVQQYPAGGYADGDSFRQQTEPSVPTPTTIFQPGGAAHVPVPAPKETWVGRANEEGRLSSTGSAVSTPKRPIDIFVQNFILGQGPDKVTAARALLAYKKQCKKSWTALGVSIDVWELATQLALDADMGVKAPASKSKATGKASSPAPQQLAKPVKAKKAAAKVKVITKGNTTVVKATASKGVDLRDVIGMPVPAVKKAAPTKPKVKAVTTTTKRSQKAEAAHLLEIYTHNPDYINCKQLVAFKRAAKKGWSALGIDEVLGKRLEARVKV